MGFVTELAVPGRRLISESLGHCIRARSQALKIVDCSLDQVNRFFLQIEFQRVARHTVLKFVSWIVHQVNKNLWIAGVTKHGLIEVAPILYLFLKGVTPPPSFTSFPSISSAAPASVIAGSGSCAQNNSIAFASCFSATSVAKLVFECV